ncbi:MAG: ATP-dependent DNA helicase [Mariprofundaceae bacterium]|nr:ATP-dependent DNA helicase [Mariprofundaceae bacterium]
MTQKKYLKKIQKDFSNTEKLSKVIPYAYRQQQVDLAMNIATCIVGSDDEQGLLIAESETGTGKTLAYLIPVLRTKKRVLISTYTRTLQDQLMFRDLPLLQKALGVSRSVALLKGRLNYLCPKRMEEKLQSHRLSAKQKMYLLRVREWAEESADGDLNALPFDVGQKGIRPLVTANAEQCLGSQCALWSRCPLMQAREKAHKADVVISNHSLMLTDLALKASNHGELLPDFDVYILDEAHHMPKLASQFFGFQITYFRLLQWHQQLQESLNELADELVFKNEAEDLFDQLLADWGLISLVDLHQRWLEFPALIESRKKRSEMMRKCHDQALSIQDDMQFIIKPDDGYVAWYEGQGEHLRFLAAPIDSGETLKKHVWSQESHFVLLSATLRISERFDYMQKNLGMPDATTCHYPSPFNYEQQALIYIPTEVADLTSEMLRLLHASEGRAFVLFTSYSALQRIAPVLKSSLPWPVLIQGGGKSKWDILEEFQVSRESILCGTRGFWEGVDMPGETLSMVIVDKLPFSPPDDPLLKARVIACENQGGNGFKDIQLPESIAVLKQGVGRLIRSMDDRGVIALLDSRIHHRFYGAEIIANLPPAKVTSHIDDVRNFFL